MSRARYTSSGTRGIPSPITRAVTLSTVGLFKMDLRRQFGGSLVRRSWGNWSVPLRDSIGLRGSSERVLLHDTK